MGVILGIDIGGSSTKIVGLHENGTVIDMLRVKAEDPLTSLYGALGNFLATHSLKLTDIGHIALTGVGASYVDGDIYGVRTVKVEEFPSVGVGGLALSRKERAVVVSMGTGTSLLWAEKGGEIRHIIGSGIGGGTLSGLSELITGVHQYALIRKLCQDGDLSQIDLTIGDMSKGKVGTLPPEATAAHFAKLAEDATRADKLRGLVNLVLQAPAAPPARTRSCSPARSRCSRPRTRPSSSSHSSTAWSTSSPRTPPLPPPSARRSTA